MSDLATVKTEIVKCPLCNLGGITVTTRSEYYNYKAARAFGKVKMIPLYHPEQTKVENTCPKCKANKSYIKEALEKGNNKTMSHEERLKRIKDSGLPLVLEGKRKE